MTDRMDPVTDRDGVTDRADVKRRRWVRVTGLSHKIAIDVSDAAWARFRRIAKECGESAAEYLARMMREAAEGRWPFCEECRRPFRPTRKDSRYCSNKCRQKAYRDRRADCMNEEGT